MFKFLLKREYINGKNQKIFWIWNTAIALPRLIWVPLKAMWINWWCIA